MSGRRATFVLSTGRCGTQWLADALARVAGGAARVEHEPLHGDYQSRLMLGAVDPACCPARPKKVAEHVEMIERELAHRDYIETGHPCWSSLPWMARRLGGRVRVIHLVRHPVPTACSWLSHGAFMPPLLPHLPAKELLAPSDAGVSFPEYAESWPVLTPIEKCLYYWSEVNSFGLKLERAGGLPWLRVSYEALFDPRSDTLERLAAFLGFPPGCTDRIDRGAPVDRHRFALGDWPEPERIAQHPRIVAVAKELGYRAESFSAAEIAGRFLLRH